MGRQEYVGIGSTPWDEDCVQVSKTEDYYPLMRCEAQIYKEMLQRIFKPTHAVLGIKTFPHDFGSYIEVVAYYDYDDPESVDEAFKIENNAPAKWDGQGLKDLRERCGIKR